MEWKLVPVEPTEDMRTAFFSAMVSYVDYREKERNLGNGWEVKADYIFKAMLEAAPTPPAQEDEPVGYVSPGTISELRDGHHKGLTIQPRKGIIYSEPLYTRPADDKLRKAAEEAEVSLEALFHMINNFEIDPETIAKNIAATIDNLRAASERKPTPSNTDKPSPA